MFTPNPDHPESSSSSTSKWLSELRPASASALQASVFYQAGYEAARRDLSKTAWRRASICAIAASVLMASVSGALLFQLGKQNGQAVTASSPIQQGKPIEAPQPDHESQLASATPIRKTPSLSGTSPMPSWFRSQFSSMQPSANGRITLLGPGVELGRMGAPLAEVVVLNNDTSSHSSTHSSLEKEQPTEPQSLRTLRDNQIKSLIESVL